MIVCVIVTIIFKVSCDSCFTTNFPRIVGGELGDTYLLVVKADSGGNLVVGGRSFSSDLIPATTYMPIAIFIQEGGNYKWQLSFNIFGSGVTGVAFHPDESKVLLAINPINLSATNAYFYFCIHNTIDGSKFAHYAIPLIGTN